jgi:DNA-binding LacI/PurR family transcriptional regulator
VSKALNDYSDIGEETKKKVREAAEQAGYFPNSSARALKTNRTYNLGVLFVDDAHSGLTHDFFAAVLEGFKGQAESCGYDITFTIGKNGSRNMSYLEHCKYRGVDGVVIACIDFYQPAVQQLIYSDLPVVTIDHVFDNRSAVMSDNISGMRELITYICQMGHRRIAYIHGADSSVSRNRISSFYRTTDEFGIDIPDSYIKEAGYRDTAAAEKMTHELLSLPKKPTCILYPDDFAALGGIKAIRERGLRIPEDISIAGYDGIRISQELSPKLTTIMQNAPLIGARAAEILIDMIERPKKAVIEHLTIQGELIRGESVRDLNR